MLLEFPELPAELFELEFEIVVLERELESKLERELEFKFELAFKLEREVDKLECRVLEGVLEVGPGDTELEEPTFIELAVELERSTVREDERDDKALLVFEDEGRLLLLELIDLEDIAVAAFLLEFEKLVPGDDLSCDELLDDPSSAGEPAPPPQAVRNINSEIQNITLIFYPLYCISPFA